MYHLPPQFCTTTCLVVHHPGEGRWLRVPLLGVSAEANVVDFCSEVTVRQTFHNSLPYSDLEATYVFPLDSKASVYALEVDIDGRKTVGKVEAKEEAKRTYDRAVAKGDSAQLLEQARGDVFQLKVGNLRPGETAEVTIKFVAPLDIEGDAVRFHLPVSVCPRYTPAFTPGSGTSAQERRDTAVAARGGGGVSQTEEGLAFKLNCVMPSEITSITSPSHALDVTLAPHSQHAACALAARATHLDKELVVLISTREPHQPRAVVERDEARGTTAGLVTFAPKFDLADHKCEFVFVVDRSGSMGGAKMQQASRALLLFLKSLPADCYFNVVGFGSRFEKLWPKSQKYAQHTLDKATQHAKALSANLGGTELLKPLQDIFSARRPRELKGYTRQVFVLTDGAVSNTTQVADLVRASCGGGDDHRLFSLGVGNDVSHELVDAIAKAGKGTAEFAVNGERLEGKVIRQLHDAMQPSITDVQVEWIGVDPDEAEAGANKAGDEAGNAGEGEGFVPVPETMASGLVGSLLGFVSPKRITTPRGAPKPPTFEQTPHCIPPIFSGSRFAVYFLLHKDSPRPSAARITATTPDGKLGLELPVREEDYLTGNLVHRLAAKSLLAEYEAGTSRLHGSGHSQAEIRSAATDLGCAHQLASKFTSFVAVQHRPDRPDPIRILPYYGPHVVHTVTTTTATASAAFARAGGYGGRNRKAMAKCSAPSPSFCAAPSAAPKKSSSLFSGFGFSGFGGGSAVKRQNAAAPTLAACNSFAGPRPSGRLSRMSSSSAPRPAVDCIDDAMDDLCAMECLADECAPLQQQQQQQGLHMKMKRKKGRVDNFGDMDAPPATTATSTADIAFELALLQAFDGSFKPTAELAALLWTDDASLTKACPTATTAQAWATAVVVAFTQLKLSAYKDEWVVFITKARKWLAATADAAALGSAAAAFVEPLWR